MKNRWRFPLAVFTAISVTSGMWTTAFAADGGSSSASAGSSASASTSADLAKPQVSQQQAVDTVTQLLGISAEFKMTGAQLQQNWSSYTQPVYNIQWQGPQIRTVGPMNNRFPEFINAVVDANTGTILTVNGNKAGVNWFDAPTITPSQAQQSAQAWLQKLAPQQSAQMKLDASAANPYGTSGYSFRYVRMVNNIPAPFDGALVTLAPDGSLLSYQFFWHDVTFPDASASTSLDAANSAYRTALGLHLQYVPSFNQSASQPMVLSYAPSPATAVKFGYGPFATSGPWVDAMSGAALGTDGQTLPASTTATYTPLVSGGPAQLPTSLSTPIDQTAAEAAARKALNLTSDTKLNQANQSQYSGPGGISGSEWDLSFQAQGSSTSQFQVAVDANTGVVSSYQVLPFSPGAAGQGKGITDEQAQQAASDFLKQVFATMTGAIAQTPTSSKYFNNGGGTQYSENFPLLYNGIPVSYGINVGLDGDGKVIEMNFSPWMFEAQYPPSTNVVSITQAEDAYVKQAPLQLEYQLPAVPNTSAQPGQSQFQYGTKALLVYAPDWSGQTSELDAQSGQWVSFLGASGGTPTDIDSHAGAQEIAILAQHGTLPLTDGKANPDRAVKRAEFVSWLVKATGMYYGNEAPTQPFTDVPTSNPYYSDLQQAIVQGWLPAGGAFNPDQPITRAAAADLIVRWLGWTEIASKSDMFASTFNDAKDIPSGALGEAVIANEFGIIPAVNGSFLSTNDMTVADAAVAIVHAFRAAYDGR